MHPLAGGQIKARENGDAPLPGRGSDRVHPADMIVIGHRQHSDAKLRRFVRQRLNVIRFVERRRLATVSFGVVMRIDLQGTPVELSARRQTR